MGFVCACLYMCVCVCVEQYRGNSRAASASQPRILGL